MKVGSGRGHTYGSHKSGQFYTPLSIQEGSKLALCYTEQSDTQSHPSRELLWPQMARPGGSKFVTEGGGGEASCFGGKQTWYDGSHKNKTAFPIFVTTLWIDLLNFFSRSIELQSGSLIFIPRIIQAPSMLLKTELFSNEEILLPFSLPSRTYATENLTTTLGGVFDFFFFSHCFLAQYTTMLPMSRQGKMSNIECLKQHYKTNVCTFWK